EIVPFRRCGPRFICRGGHPLIHVDPSLLAVLAPSMRRSTEAAGERQSEKIEIDLRWLGHWAGLPQRMAVLIFLGPRLRHGQSAFRFDGLSPSETLIELLENTYTRRVQSPSERRRHLRVCAAAARVLPAYRLLVREGI